MRKAYESGANTTSMNMAKNRQIFFLNLEKQRGSQITIKKLVFDEKEITYQTHLLGHIREFYKTLFKTREQETATEVGKNSVMIKLSENQVKLCEEDLTEKDLYNSLKSMQSDKSPSNDGLAKEFYQTFWNELKEIFVDFVSEAKENRHLSTSQRQAIINLIEKRIETRDSFKTGDSCPC